MTRWVQVGGAPTCCGPENASGITGWHTPMHTRIWCHVSKRRRPSISRTRLPAPLTVVLPAPCLLPPHVRPSACMQRRYVCCNGDCPCSGRLGESSCPAFCLCMEVRWGAWDLAILL